MKVEFTVPGKPIPKARARTVRNGTRTYTPTPTVTYENLVKYSYWQKYKGFKFPDDVALKMDILAQFEIPKSMSNKQRQQILNGNTHYTKKGDADNIAKAILDPLNGLAYRDDAQVSDLNVKKRYGELPMARVTITVIGEQNEKESEF